jgi:DNA-directed RNA polymerase subunit K/omega
MPSKRSLNKKPKKKDEEDDIPDIEVEAEEDDVIDDVEEPTDEGDVDGQDEDEDEEDEDEDIKFIEEEGKDCAIEKAIDDDNEYFDNEDDIEVQPDTTVEYVKSTERISASKLTKYEMVRILGERTKQLTMGAKPLIKNYEGLPYDRIAEEELKLNMTPFKIRRPLPNGKFELWELSELNKQHLISLLD